MSATGFDHERAQDHERCVEDLCQVFNGNGFRAVPLDVDGHRPDIAVRGWVDWPMQWLEVKFTIWETNLSIAANAFDEQTGTTDSWQPGDPVRGKWTPLVYAYRRASESRYRFIHPRNLLLCRDGGRRPAAKSKTEWYLFRNPERLST